MPSAVLTPRERQILAAMANGQCYKEVAFRFRINWHTVKNHCSHIRESLGAANMTQAVAIAIRRALIP